METRTQELRSFSSCSVFVVREGRYLVNEKFKVLTNNLFDMRLVLIFAPLHLPLHPKHKNLLVQIIFKWTGN